MSVEGLGRMGGRKEGVGAGGSVCLLTAMCRELRLCSGFLSIGIFLANDLGKGVNRLGVSHRP